MTDDTRARAEKIKDAEDAYYALEQTRFAVQAFLRRQGWDYTCNTPGMAPNRKPKLYLSGLTGTIYAATSYRPLAGGDNMFVAGTKQRTAAG